MNLEASTAEILEGATNVEKTVTELREYLDTLNKTVNDLVPTSIEADWALNLKETLDKFYKNQVEAALQAMAASASNMKMSAEAAAQFSKDA